MQAALANSATRGARRQATSASDPARTPAKSSAPASGVESRMADSRTAIPAASRPSWASGGNRPMNLIRAD
ncbi:hypothetical protein [Actinomadura madurae]|uniref:hypothetical protein n=1 Tax=Actinomadura madurae TaxID=1993 RepID=UPI0020D237ED|nr:hypothetical protein [Actinomadura madurae]MCP9966528.1 hypothetical protein [Actinomadura madurae]MCP9979018.1 hypothetical protein [Actinomadura madurae]MCQ0015202.1 hypothetical protein [Actinomadura madurae]